MNINADGLKRKNGEKMSVFKKISVICLCLILTVCVFVACDNSGDNGKETSAATSAETTTKTSAETTVESSADTETDHVHEWGEWTTTIEATCTARGEERRDCKNCDYYETQGVKAAGHDYTSVVTSPSCTSQGYTTHTCDCGDSYVDTYVRATGHDYASVVTAPTCTQQGYTTHTCNCGDSYVDNYVNAAGHRYDTGKIVTEATCIQAGQKKYTCTVATCNYSYTEPYSLPTYTATEIYNQAVKYVGEITTYDKKGNEYALGTGFIYSSDGKLITNYHVIDGAYSAKVNINGVTYTVASVLAYDSDIDLAVLKINATGLDAATICKKPVQVATTVYAIGSSRGLTNTYSQGIVTYADRVIEGVSYVQHDASITHGNSGGPLINAYGEVIGINTWGISDSQNLNFAVFTGELDNLVYGTPISLSDLYEKTQSAYDKLAEWICANITTTYDDYVAYYYRTDNSQYCLSYHNDGSICVSVLNDTTDLTMWTQFEMTRDATQFSYWGILENNNTDTIICRAYGSFNVATYTEDTLLPYSDYEGHSEDFEEFMSLCDLSVNASIEWLEYIMLINNLGDLIDLGFTSY